MVVENGQKIAGRFAEMTLSATAPSRCLPEPQPVPVSDLPLIDPAHADELCDQLMEHTFDCDACLNGQEETCQVFCSLQDEIAKAGGPIKGAALTM
jgi:hypothetical protein